MTRLFAFILLLITAPAQVPETVVAAHIVGVVDGDTIRALTSDNQLLRVRLRNIDAPEKGQAFGQASKQNLSRYIFGRDVELHVFGTDRYGRTLAVIMVNGVDINLQQVRDGYAWVYEKYIGENSPGVQARYPALRSKQSNPGAILIQGLIQGLHGVQEIRIKRAKKSSVKPRARARFNTGQRVHRPAKAYRRTKKVELD